MTLKKHYILVRPETHKRLRIMAANRDCTMNWLAAFLIDREWVADDQARQQISKGEKQNGSKEDKVPSNRR